MPRKRAPAPHGRTTTPRVSRRFRSRASRLQSQHAGRRPAFGLGAQLHAGYRLVRVTPGLPVYLTGGVLVWMLGRMLTAQDLGVGRWGALTAGVLKLLGLSLVVILYFRRTGQLAEISAGFARLRALRCAEEAIEHRVWWRELGRHVRLRQTQQEPGATGMEQ